MGRFETPTNFLDGKNSVGFQFLQGDAAEEGVTFFGGLQFLHKTLKT